MADYIAFDAENGVTMDVLPAGTPFEVQDWDEDVLAKNGIHISNMDFGTLIEGTKDQLVALLEGALHQAWALPDDPAD